jgi:transcriptional regulator with GAF, ATPase, and Fis domain
MSLDDEQGESLEDFLDRARLRARRIEEDNQQLRQRVAELVLELEHRDVQAHSRRSLAELAPDAKARLVEELEARLAELSADHEALQRDHADLERQNSNFLSLYVASSQIHATLVFEDVVRNIKEIVINLIGADIFSIYLYSEASQEFRRVASEGSVDSGDEMVPFGDNLLSRIARAGRLCLELDEEGLPSGHRPIAVLPLRVGEQLVGAVVLFRLLVQKSDFDSFDMELFNLLAAHAATALMSSAMYRRLERKNKTLHGLLHLFKSGGAPGGALDD